MSVDQISSIADLTSGWLTNLLRSTGDLDASTSVSNVAVAPFGSEEAMMSSLVRIEMTFDGETEAPTSLIVKLASQSEGARFIAALFQFYQREIRFYNELLPQVPIKTPRCLHAEMYPDDQGFVLVLEEVAGCRQVDQLEGLDFADAALTLESLADMHAPFWGADLTHFADTMLPFNSDLVSNAVPAKAAEDWGLVRPTLIDELPAEITMLLDNFGDVVPPAINDFMGTNTIVHGDSRADNLLFHPDGSVIILDFQLMAVSHGMFDVAYVISQSLNEVTQARAAELIDVYLARIASHGIDVEPEHAAAAYRGAVVFNLSIPLSTLATEGLPDRAIELGQTMLRRASQEILRTGGHEAYQQYISA